MKAKIGYLLADEEEPGKFFTFKKESEITCWESWAIMKKIVYFEVEDDDN